MAGLDKTIIDFSTSGQSNGGILATPTASTSAALPAQTELLMLTASCNAHFRVGVGAQTAVVADPMITAGITLVVKLNPDLQYNIAAIFDSTSTAGNVSYFRVMEG